MTTTDLPEIPEYFLKDVEMNIQGARPLAEIPLPSPLTPLDVLQRIQEGAIVLDTRTTADFGTAHIAGAIHIGLSGQFAPWSGAILKEPRSLVIHAQSVEKVREAVMRLARVGIERVVGYVDGGILAWERANQSIKRLPQVTVQELEARRLESPTAQIVDVRRPAEFVSGHVPGAQSVPLDRLETQMSGLDRKKPTFVICASGYRSSLGCSLLERAGFEELYNIVGGTSAWTATGLPLETARAA